MNVGAVGRRPIAAVTGANGYVGSLAVSALLGRGFSVRRLVREPQSEATDYQYDILDCCSVESLRNIDVLVHCAYDFSATSRDAVWAVNVFGNVPTSHLAVAAQVRRTIVVSSMSAYPGTRQIYGRAKLAIETEAFARDMFVIRPGLVYGPSWGGMAGTLRKLTSLPIVPLVGGGSYQFTLHEDDLRHAIGEIAVASEIAHRPLGLAHAEPVSTEQLIGAIARTTSTRKTRFVSIPWLPTYWAIRAVENNVQLPIRADSLLGLVRPAPSVPGTTEVRDLGITFRPFDLSRQ